MPRGIYKREPIIKTGDKYGRLTAIEFSHKKKYVKYWLFRCYCGNEKVIIVNDVKRGCTKSCGCLLGKNSKHGMFGTKTYYSWQAMKQRCLYENYKRYKDYGGRGITICSEWMNFENFYKDMGKRPVGKTLDRIKNNLGYYKENCCWSSPEQQANNKRNNHLLTYKGKTLTIGQWAKKAGIPYQTLWTRISRSWSIEKVLIK